MDWLLKILESNYIIFDNIKINIIIDKNNVILFSAQDLAIIW